MQVLIAVMRDLWSFVLGELGFRAASTAETSPDTSWRPVVPVTATEQPMLLPGSEVSLDQATATVEAEPTASPQTQRSSAAMVGGQVYIRYPDTPCHLRPGQALDTMIGTLPYATAVTVLSQRDGWLQISSDIVEGWIEEVMITTDPAAVFPTFVLDEQYDVDHPETMKVRTYIKDEFGGGVAGSALLSCEYVWYRLVREGRDFSWPLTRPRTAGRWADILQGAPTAHVGSVPLTGGVMEYLDVEGNAQLFYVTAVRPDEAVVVSGILPVPLGVYSERTIAQPDWHALGARFINKK